MGIKVSAGDAASSSSCVSERESPSYGPRERASSAVERRQLLAKQIQEEREDEVLDLHAARSAHYIDNAFSLVTANMAVVSLVLGCVYMSRPCEKPLAGFLVVLGLLAPFAACLPIVLRQWFYLHLRLMNVVTLIMLLAAALYVAWLLVGQRWAFESSAKTCDPDLSTAANVVVFVLYLMLLLYTAKVVWYLAVRARYSYWQLCLSCFRDPYPNALHMTDTELDALETQLDDAPPESTPADAKPEAKKKKKHRVLMELQRHQHELRQSLHRLLHSPSAHEPTLHGVTPIAPARDTEHTSSRHVKLKLPKPRTHWALDFRKPTLERTTTKAKTKTGKRTVNAMIWSLDFRKTVESTQDPEMSSGAASQSHAE